MLWRQSFFVFGLCREVARVGHTPDEIHCPEKMLLDLSQEHKEHLAFLPQVDSRLGDLAMESGVLWDGEGAGERPGLLPSMAMVTNFALIASIYI